MVKAQDWWNLKNIERNNLLKTVNTFLDYSEKYKRCIFQYNKSFQNKNILFIIEFIDGSFTDVRNFKINGSTLTRSYTIQCTYKDKIDLIKNSKAFEFSMFCKKDAIKFSNVQFDNQNNLCYGLVKQLRYEKTKKLEHIYY